MTEQSAVSPAIAKTGRRARFRTVFAWSQDFLNTTPALKDQKVKAFQSVSGAKYAMHPTSGSFVRLDKDRRSPKERKAAKRAAREAALTAPAAI
jgi:hypothetical protein